MTITKEHVGDPENGIPSFLLAEEEQQEEEQQGYSKSIKKRDVGNIEKGIPSLVEEEEVYTYQDPNFKDYTKLSNFTKKTGIEADGFPSFAFKELVDNAIDFEETYYKGSSPTIKVYMSNNPTTGLFTITVVCPNDSNIEVFPLPYLKKVFNYLGAFSSKSNQYRIARGAQGVALKQLATLAYMKYGKNWKYPIIFQHNGRIDEVYITVDRKCGKIIPSFKNGGEVVAAEAGGNTITDTKITITLPAITLRKDYKRMMDYCKEYTLFNTHISYEFHFNDDHGGGPVIKLPAQHPISKDYENPNTVYCYSEEELYDLLNDFAAADDTMSFYKAASGFREIKQKDNRFGYLKTMTLKHDLTEESSNRLFKQLRASMLPMSKISDPYDAKVKSRRDALIDRYLQIKPYGLDVDVERAIYVRTKDHKTKGDNIHKDSKNGTRFPYRFEVLAIPIKNYGQKSIIISGVNYSTSINNKSYFTSDRYVYGWTHRRTKDFLQAWNIEGIIRNSMAGHNIDDNQNIPSEKLKQECVIICHLIAPKIGYSNGYGKSSLVLEPFYEAIPQTVQEAILKVPNRLKYTGLSIDENKTIPKLPELVYKVLLKRWNKVRLNPGILDAISPDYDPWSQSTVFYILRDEELLPLERKYNISIIKEGTRRQITAMISDICQRLPGSPKREQLGIFASPRASMYFDGIWHDVDIREIPNLAGKGTAVLFVEKRGVADQIRHLADRYGISIVNTTGHLSEYAKDLIPAIVKEDGYVAILTDFDCAGINIAEKVIKEIIDLLGEEIVDKRVKRLGLFPDDLERFIVTTTADDRKQSLQRTMVEEPYPKQSDKNKEQQPGTNVVNPIIEYAVDYDIYNKSPNWGLAKKYKRYKYIYENFQYLTGIDPDDIMNDDYYRRKCEEEDEKVKRIIDQAMAVRHPAAARRIELDSVIKVVGANRFGKFVIDKIDEFFPERNYNRAIKIPDTYIAERFHILPESTKAYFLQVFEIANTAAAPKEKEIKSELEHIKGTLCVDVEKAVNERLLSEAVASNPKIQKLEAKHSELLSLDLFNNDPDSNVQSS